ncbi:MAG: protein phosphatase CheZ [Alphaproteobacteria bacterium]|nr:protein phosphatase CheZ [Alphaproteobacteria bacterium]
MSTNNEPITADLEELSENPAIVDEAGGTDDAEENRRQLSHSEYDALEEAVMQTPRGRTFLREHARRNQAVASDLVMRALDDCKAYFQRSELKQPTEILSAELQNMSDAIAHTRRDIAAIKPKEGANNRIMAATEDLEAIVTATERATNDILAAAERIQETCGTLRENGGDDGLFDSLEEDITNIFLACSFQDITGQRTTKVVNALRYLEQRVGAMIEIWGSESLRNGTLPEFDLGHDVAHPEAGLLNGPALEGQGVGQDDIDQLLSSTSDADDSGENDGGDDADPTAGIDFDGVADPTDGVDFDAVEAPIEEDAAAAAIRDVDAAAAELDTAVPEAQEAAETADIAEEAADEVDYSNLSEEADPDTIDAIFNS